MQITGKDLILYILNNNLLDKVFIDEKTIKSILITTEAAAVKLGVGINSLLAMYEINLIPGIKIDGEVYFGKDVKLPEY